VSAAVALFASAAARALELPEDPDPELAVPDPELEDDEPALHALTSTANNTTKSADRTTEAPSCCRTRQLPALELIRPP
jgi:hypothetical protein